MTTVTLEHSVVETEDIARKSAKLVMKQSQKVSLVDKKVTAVGKTVVSINTKLNDVDKHVDIMYGTMENVIEGQDKLTTQSEELTDSWNEMSQSQSDEAANIRKIQTSLNQLTDLKTATLSELRTISDDQSEERVTDIASFKSKLITLNEQLKTADNSDEIMALETAINEAVDNIKQYQEEQNKRTLVMNERIDRVTRVTGLLTTAVSQYETLLTTMNTKVTYISDMVDTVNDRVSNLHQTGLDMTDEDIIQLFEDYTPEEVFEDIVEVGTIETKSIETKPAVIEPEITDEPVITDEPEITDAHDEVGAHEVDAHEDPDNKLSESEDNVIKNKKYKWQFWK